MEGLAEWKESLVDGKNPCIKCQSNGRDRSGDNFHYYGEGQGGYCHACEYTVPSDDVMAEIKSSKSSYSKTAKKEKATTRKDVNNENTFDLSDWKAMRKELSLDPSGYRGLNKDVCKKYDVLHEYSPVTGEVVKQIYPTTRDYKIVGCEFRVAAPKDFYKKGTSGNAVDLFGQAIHRNSNSKDIVITGGQLDTLSADLMFSMHQRGGYEGIAVVSPTNGESGAYKQLQYHYEWLNRFDRIILCFDNDDAGREATDKAVKILPKGKAYVLRMTKNDPNEYLVERDSASFWNAYWRVEKYVPNGITSSLNLEKAMLDYVGIPRLGLPAFMRKLEEMLVGGLPLGYIINILAASGVGKSTIINAIIIHLIKTTGFPLGIVSLEASEGEYGVNLVSSYCKMKINLLPNVESKIEYLSKPENVALRKELWENEDGDPNFYIVDADVSNMQSKIEYLVRGLGCKLVVIDPVQDILDELSGEDQAKWMKWEKDMVKKEGMIIINISHSRKSPTGAKANSRGAELSEEDMMGHSSVFKSGGINIVLGRDKEAECIVDRNTTTARITKSRGVGRTGYAGSWLYVEHEDQLYDKDWYLKKFPNYVKDSNKKVDSQVNKGDNGYTKVIKTATKAPIKKAITNETDN